MSSFSQTSSEDRVARSAAVVSLATMASRLLGYVRDMLLAYSFGGGGVQAAFLVAFRLPNLLRRLLGEGTLSAAFVPAFTEVLVKDGKVRAWELASSVINLLAAVLSVVSLLGVVGAPYIISLLTLTDPGLGETQLAVGLTRIMFPYIFFVGLAALAMGILNSQRHFASSAMSPVVLNLSMIASIIFLSPFLGKSLEEQIYGVAYGVLIGGLGQLMVQLPALFKKGVNYRFSLNIGHPQVRKIGLLMLPGVVGMAADQVNILVDTMLAWRIGPYAVPALYFSIRLLELPLGAFAVSIATAVLPAASEYAAVGDRDRFKETLSFALRLIFFISIPATAGLIVLRHPIISLLFEHGEFDSVSTGYTAWALLFYSIGIPAIGGVRVIVQGFYSLKDIRTPVKVGLTAVIANIALSLALMGPLKHGGLALATSVAGCLNFIVLFGILSRRVGGLGLRRVLRSLLRVAAASAIMGLAAWWTISRFDYSHPTLSYRVLALTVSLAVGIIVYSIFVFLFRAEEASALRRMVMERWASKRN